MLVDMVGKVCGELLVLSRNGSNKAKGARWLCRCSCGEVVTVDGADLRKGHTKSCGCLKTRNSKYKTPEYRAWLHMKQRCDNENNGEYKNYGARGITYCKEWSCFNTFLEDLGERPSKTHSLDRIDVNGDYNKQNCRWATKTVQSLNRRKLKNKTSRYKGVSWSKKDSIWSVCISEGGKSRYVGSYRYEKEAAYAFDAAARALGYEERWLNFPKKEEIL